MFSDCEFRTPLGTSILHIVHVSLNYSSTGVITREVAVEEEREDEEDDEYDDDEEEELATDEKRLLVLAMWTAVMQLMG